MHARRSEVMMSVARGSLQVPRKAPLSPTISTSISPHRHVRKIVCRVTSPVRVLLNDMNI